MLSKFEHLNHDPESPEDAEDRKTKLEAFLLQRADRLIESWDDQRRNEAFPEDKDY